MWEGRADITSDPSAESETTMKQTQTMLHHPRREHTLLLAIAFVAALTLAGTARAQQWTTSTNGTSNISNANSGNVGVGTTAPAYGLHVEGASTVTNNYVQGLFRNTGAAFPYGGVGVDGQQQSHLRFMLGGLPKWQWRVGAGAGTDDLRAYNWALGADVLTLTNSGGVGVGTSTPLSRLHVEGGAGLGSIRVSGSGMAVMNFKDTAAPVNQKLYQWRSQGGVFRMTLLTDNEASDALANILVANSAGQVGIGTASPMHTLEVAGTINASGAITGATINASFQDVAEWVPSTQKLGAGTVVVLDAGRTNHVVASAIAYDTKVAGVVSEQPGVLLGVAGEGKLKVATTGRVRVKVDASRGAIKVGDLLVTSEVEGVAMKSEPILIGGRQMHAPGTIIGKALEPLEKGVGEILVLLSLQ
jgi:hypothetical protein